MIYNLPKIGNSKLMHMLRVHDYLLMKSRDFDYVGYEELYQFYASPGGGSSTCANTLEKIGIIYRDIHPTKNASGQPKALFFLDRELLARTVEEIKAEITMRGSREKPTKSQLRRERAVVRLKSKAEYVNNLDSMLNMLAPKRRNDNVRSE